MASKLAKKSTFIGRAKELAKLAPFLKKKTASLLVIKGRRRVGKSRLADQFAQGHRYYRFAGLAPSVAVTGQEQRDEFARAIAEQFDLPNFQMGDWADLFSMLAKQVSKGRVIILFDEISWMAAQDNTFLSKLKNAWEFHFKQNDELILILCSSISIWIEENILSSTGFFGRISWHMHLEPLPIRDSSKMLESQGFKSSPYEKFVMLSVTGGIPWYIEQVHGRLSAHDNIKRLCFTKGGMLVDDFERIFHDLFDVRGDIYKKIVMALSNGHLTYDELANAIDYPKSGRLSNYIHQLVDAGFIRKDQNWSIKTGLELDLYKYRLSDNYLRFYLKYIFPRRTQIENDRFSDVQLTTLPEWECIMGLQFENLVINNRHELYPLIGIAPEDIVYDNPFFQRKTSRQKGCQIDFLIQTKQKTLYLCEIKFSRKPITKNVIAQVKLTLENLSLPRGVAVYPVLIHVNGVRDSVIESDFFHSIIDFSELLNKY